MVKEATDLSVLVAGCGSIAKRHARVLRGLGVTDIRACDPVLAQREALARETSVSLFESYEQGLASRPDTVFICTPPHLHLPMAHQAIAAGAHVFCEKPLADSSQGLDALAFAAEAAGKKVMTGLCFRYHEGLIKAKNLLISGRRGRLVSIRCLVGEHFPTVRPDYRTLFSAQVGGAFDLTHEVDLAAWFAGQAAQRVRSVAGTFSDLAMEAPDIAEILVAFVGRCVASIHLDFFQQPRRRLTELICTAGVITVEFSSWDHCTISHCGPDAIWSCEELATDRNDMFRAEDTAFLEAVALGRPVECGIREARQSIDIIERAAQDAGIRLIAGHLPLTH